MAVLTRDRKRGFTLTELMVVIIVITTLSAVSIPIFTEQLRRQRIFEAQATMTLIKSAEEAHRAADPDGCYLKAGNNPAGAPPKMLKNWEDIAPWHTDLNILNSVDRQTRFQYHIYAGGLGNCADEAVPGFGGCVSSAELNNYWAAGTPWYVITAEGDLDKSGGSNTFIISTKQRSTFVVCNEGQ